MCYDPSRSVPFTEVSRMAPLFIYVYTGIYYYFPWNLYGLPPTVSRRLVPLFGYYSKVGVVILDRHTETRVTIWNHTEIKEDVMFSSILT